MQTLEPIAPVPRPFALRWHGCTTVGEGLRWWNEGQAEETSLDTAPSRTNRRKVILGAGALGVSILTFYGLFSDSDDDDLDVSMDALELQKREGWNAGQPEGTPLIFETPSPTNVDGVAGAFDAVGLWNAVHPIRNDLRPHSVSTLFLSLTHERSESLRRQVVPVFRPSMGQAFDRGLAIAKLFDAKDAPTDIALVLDVPGPDAVAVAAGLSTRFDPVWLFDNWPHPLGVVKSHLVLGALRYYLPLLRRNAELRSAAALDQPPRTFPPVFVLDSDRLAPYVDDANHFDNRYLARPPSAEALKTLGCRRILYVRPSGEKLLELDDLNDDFVRFHDNGVDVKAIALDDFSLELNPASSNQVARSYYYGGGYGHHMVFWHSYGWSSIGAGPKRYLPPATVSRGADYRPVSRPTMFSSRSLGGLSGVGKTRPSGFGSVSVRTSSSGQVTGVRSGRSGSFGRSRSSWFG